MAKTNGEGQGDIADSSNLLIPRQPMPRNWDRQQRPVRTVSHLAHQHVGESIPVRAPHTVTSPVATQCLRPLIRRRFLLWAGAGTHNAASSSVSAFRLALVFTLFSGYGRRKKTDLLQHLFCSTGDSGVFLSLYLQFTGAKWLEKKSRKEGNHGRNR